MKNIFLSQNRTFKVHLAEGYSAEYSDDDIQICNQVLGVGTITISTYIIPKEYDFRVEVELKDFASSFAPTPDEVRVENRINNKSAEADFVTNETYWIIWCKFRSPIALFASYNCSVLDSKLELDCIKKMVNSIEILG